MSKHDFNNMEYDAEAYNFTQSITPPWVFFTFFKLHKCYQMAQSITYVQSFSIKPKNYLLNLETVLISDNMKFCETAKPLSSGKKYLNTLAI